MMKKIFAGMGVAILVIAFLVPFTIGQAQAGPLVATVAPTATLAVTPTSFPSARFRLVNAANTSSPLDVLVDGSAVASGLTAVQALNVSGYLAVSAVPTGTSHTVTLTLDGTTTAVGTPLTFTFVQRAYYTFVLLPDMTWLTFTDNRTAPPLGTEYVNEANFSPSNNPVGVAIDGAVPTQFAGLAYQSETTSPATVTTGAHMLTIPNTTAKAIAFTFQDYHDYTVFVFWNPTLNAPKILVKADASFAALATVTPTVMPTVGATPTVLPTVGVTQTIRLFLPVIEDQ